MTSKLPSQIMFDRLNAMARSKGLPERDSWLDSSEAETTVPELAFEDGFFENYLNDLIVNVYDFSEGLMERYPINENILLIRNLTEFNGNQLWICNEVNSLYRANIVTKAFYCRIMLSAAWNNGNSRVAPGEDMVRAKFSDAQEWLGGKNGLPPAIMKIEQAMGSAIGVFRELVSDPEFIENSLEVQKLRTVLNSKRDHLAGGLQGNSKIGE